MCKAADASDLEKWWDDKEPRSVNFGMGRVVTRILKYRSKLRDNKKYPYNILWLSSTSYWSPNSTHEDLAILGSHGIGFRARERAFDASGRGSGLIYVLCYYFIFSVISSLTLSGKNRLSAWPTWSAMHRGHLFFSSSDQTFHPY